MVDETKDLLRAALRLPLPEREELAVELLASLDADSAPEGAEAAWAIEIERRAGRAYAGISKGTDWQTVRNEIEEYLERS